MAVGARCRGVADYGSRCDRGVLHCDVFEENVSNLPSRRIAIVGARGVANYGGFETFVAELGPRLVREGFQVFCSQRGPGTAVSGTSYRGMKMLSFPFRFPKSGKLSRVFEVLYDFYFVLKCAIGLKCDTIYCLGVVSGFVLPILRLTRTRIMVNVDGIEWRRQKFGLLERCFLKSSFQACGIFADIIIIDNSQLIDHVPARYRPKSLFIPYGVCETNCHEGGNLSMVPHIGGGVLPLRQRGYWLVVARLEPENNIDMIIDAYLGSGSTSPLVIVGGFSSSAYETRIRALIRDSDDGRASVLFTGPIFNHEVLTSLRCNCRAYVHGHSVGGTNPSLLEAMSAGNVIAAHDNVFNREVCADTALYFDTSLSLREILTQIEIGSHGVQEMATRARFRALKDYRWDVVTEKYVEALSSLS